MSENYTKRELDKEHELTHTSIDKLTERMNVGFDGVHKRQDTANGRLKKLEMWRAGMVGGMAVITTLLVPILLLLLRNIL